MFRSEYYYPYEMSKYYKYRPWMDPSGNVYVYKMYRGRTSWFKLFLAAAIGAYIGQNYSLPKIEGPSAMFAKFKEFISQYTIKPDDKPVPSAPPALPAQPTEKSSS